MPRTSPGRSEFISCSSIAWISQPALTSTTPPAPSPKMDTAKPQDNPRSPELDKQYAKMLDGLNNFRSED